MKWCGNFFVRRLSLCAAILFSFSAVPTSRAADLPAWNLVWSDEFNQPDGSLPDATKWAFDLGGNGWGNNELETYTSRTNNARIENGMLVIEARREDFTGTDGRKRAYTSARLKTKALAAWTYGRFEARIKIPAGQGIWPAFWMLGDNMENIGREPAITHGTAHGPGYSGAGGIGGQTTLPAGKKFADDFHLFAVEWDEGRLRWSVDNVPYFSMTPTNLPVGAKWVFNQPQFLLLNLAVGGNWPGAPDATTQFPQQMLVDFVRVYSRTNAPRPALRIEKKSGALQMRWPGEFPMAEVEQTSDVAGAWTLRDHERALDAGEFILLASDGFFRLRLAD
jgi:beta-glucanase (GH16 family)